VAITIPPAAYATESIRNRIDALAELIDVQNSMRKLICKGKPVGEAVTVTAQEI